jgi:cytochrome c biogenesis protein
MDQQKAMAERVYDFFASVRLSLFLFGALAATSIFGTLIPQDATFEQRLRQYGPKLNSLIELLDLVDMYHSWWFRLLLVLLTINLIVCSLRRLPKTLKLLQAGKKVLSPVRLEKMHSHARVKLSLPLSEARSQVATYLGRKFSACFWQEQDGTWLAVAEKGRLGRFGVYFVHLSVLTVFVGALIGSVFGFRGFVTIPEKEAVEQVILRGTGVLMPLDFEIRCDKFNVDFYETGAPKEFRSDVSILEGGRVVRQAAIRVNEPFTYKGITFFQSTYGSEPSGIVLRLRDLKTGESRRLEVPFRQAVGVPGTKDRLVVMDYAENISNFGPAFFVAMARENQEPASAWIIAKQVDFHGNRIDDLGIAVESYKDSFYTGLQVKKDPGVWVIYFGFTLMLLSMIVTLYTSHRRVWLALMPESDGTLVLLGGNASKHLLTFGREFDQLTKEISALDPDRRL